MHVNVHSGQLLVQPEDRHNTTECCVVAAEEGILLMHLIKLYNCSIIITHTHTLNASSESDHGGRVRATLWHHKQVTFLYISTSLHVSVHAPLKPKS